MIQNTSPAEQDRARAKRSRGKAKQLFALPSSVYSMNLYIFKKQSVVDWIDIELFATIRLHVVKTSLSEINCKATSDNKRNAEINEWPASN